MVATHPSRYTNHLIHETSPYLLQHAHNPVEWYPWGEEAFKRAREEDKPIFLSIGYAACHWCHVMERESFENEELALILNRHFISIKVDREERPDLDELYMTAVQLMSGSGGWPMSVFLMPDGKPFFGGTYFPPEDQYGRIGFRKVLEQIQQAYKGQRERVIESSKTLTEAIIESAAPMGGERALRLELLTTATRELRARYDAAEGGFGDAPKFPPSLALNLLLREYKRTGEVQTLEMIERTLRKMAQGGMSDQIGGGFHRYSVDPVWLVPHFEKMLYDNALLAPVYFDAAVVTGDPFYKEVGCQILDYVLREMTGHGGGFYSSQDADSEGVEGKYYVWRPAEVIQALGEKEGRLCCEYYGVASEGNWAEGPGGASIPNVRVPLEEFAMIRGLGIEDLRQRLDGMKRRLLERRGQRVPPLKDDKVLAGWNGLMISAMARGAQVTGDARYARAASKAADFILNRMRAPAGGLQRSWREGKTRVGGFLEDYAHLIVGLIDLYETDFDTGRIREANALGLMMIERFYDEREGGFFTTDGRDQTVVARLKEYYDGATPSGNAAAVHALQRLGLLLDREDYRGLARGIMRRMSDRMLEMPAAHHHLLCAVSSELMPPTEVAIIGKHEAPATRALLEAVRGKYLPGHLVVLAATDGSEGAMIEIPLLRNKSALAGKPTAYVCQNYVCRQPVHTPEELQKLLN